MGVNFITLFTCSCCSNKSPAFIGNVVLLVSRSTQTISVAPRGYVADADSLQGNTRLPFLRHLQSRLISYSSTTRFRMLTNRELLFGALIFVRPKIVLVIIDDLVRKIELWCVIQKYRIGKRLPRFLRVESARIGMRSVSDCYLTLFLHIDLWQNLGNSQSLSRIDYGRYFYLVTPSRDNEYILSGYRPASYSFRRSYASLGYIHNETSNFQPGLDTLSSLIAC